MQGVNGLVLLKTLKQRASFPFKTGGTWNLLAKTLALTDAGSRVVCEPRPSDPAPTKQESDDHDHIT